MKNIIYVYSKIACYAPALKEIVHSAVGSKYTIHYVLLNPEPNSEFELQLKKSKIPVYFIKYKDKWDLPLAALKLFFLLRKIRPEAVHTHLLDANLVGLLAAFFAGIKNRIYTRHHADQNHTLFPHAVYYDKIANLFATKIIATSQNVKQLLLELDHVKEEKITVINHGFNINYFQEKNEPSIEKLREQYKIQGKFPIIGVISRYINWKGVQYIIPAFQEVLKKYPNAHLFCANAFPTPYRNELDPLFRSLPPGSFTEIESIPDVVSLYNLFDVFVHTPINSTCEAFGMVYVESLLVGVPSVFTSSGIATEFIQNRENALVVDFCDSKQIAAAILEILSDQKLRSSLVENGKKTTERAFSYDLMAQKLLAIYESGKFK